MNASSMTMGRIGRLADDHASGELICVSDAAEVHVFFQSGRIAWATSSHRPLEFTKHLLHTAQIDVEVFREILESCQREKRPLGETLISWGVATLEEVRAALRHQIETSLSSMDDDLAVEHVFLRRPAQFADHDIQLTFELGELDLLRSTTRPRHMSVKVPETVPPPSEALMTLSRSIDGVLWTEDLRAGTTPRHVPRDIVRKTLEDGASLVTMQSSKQTLAGVALTAERSLWCLVDGSVMVGAITAVLGAIGAESAVVGTPQPPSQDATPWRVGGELPAADDALDDFLSRAADIQAVFITKANSTWELRGHGRGAALREPLTSLVRRRMMAFSSPRAPRDSQIPAEADVDGTTTFRAMTVESSCALFATEIVVEGRTLHVWVALDLHISKGVGWAYLTSLGRMLARALRQEGI